MALGSTQPLTEMSTRNIFWGVKAAGAYVICMCVCVYVCVCVYNSYCFSTAKMVSLIRLSVTFHLYYIVLSFLELLN
jgi:hypothetical protein